MFFVLWVPSAEDYFSALTENPYGAMLGNQDHFYLFFGPRAMAKRLFVFHTVNKSTDLFVDVIKHKWALLMPPHRPRIRPTWLVWFLSWDAWQEEGWAETPKTWFKRNWLIDCIVFASALAISICDRQFCIQRLMECFILLYCHNLPYMTAAKFILWQRPSP